MTTRERALSLVVDALTVAIEAATDAAERRRLCQMRESVVSLAIADIPLSWWRRWRFW